jgi:hypothetical protein
MSRDRKFDVQYFCAVMLTAINVINDKQFKQFVVEYIANYGSVGNNMQDIARYDI